MVGPGLLRIGTRFISYRDIVTMVLSMFAIVVFLPDTGEHWYDRNAKRKESVNDDYVQRYLGSNP